MIQTATARACSNIALIKYWGKRDAALNLPQNGSLSLTLDGMTTTTTVHWDAAYDQDAVSLNGKVLVDSELAKMSKFLDLIRQEAGMRLKAKVESQNNFPTAAGLASSASGFAALALAASRAAGLELASKPLSMLARQGSGSASRSIYGGFAEWKKGDRPDGLDSYAEQLMPPEAWPDVRMLVIVLEPRPKPISSRSGMTQTVATSPMYPAWLETVGADLDTAREALFAHDLEALGTVAEANALKMHATMLTTLPTILYWQPTTVALMHRVWELRRDGIPGWFTIDAGPNVKVLTDAAHATQLAEALGAVEGVERVLICAPGPGAELC
jgi:diphosphomevalonate decarboxylase